MGKILIVDDVSIVRYRLVASLTRNGYVAMAHESGPAALDILKKDAAITLVLTDGPMSGCSGMDFLRIAQKSERHNDQGEITPPSVVLMTVPDSRSIKGSHPFYRADQAESYGFAGVLLKPISEPALLECVRKYVTPPVAATP